MTSKLQALAEFLEVDPSDLMPSSYDESAFHFGNKEYLVCSEEEADIRVYEYIKETLWAFKATFLVKHFACFSELSQADVEAMIEAIETMQGKMCEDCNNLLFALVGSRFPDLVVDADESDGRGHFLASYDFTEHEYLSPNVNVIEYYIYRIN